jgi:hypothetical protein
VNDEVGQAILKERADNAHLVEDRAAEYRKMALTARRERASVFKEIAEALDRTARFIREQETVVV